MATQSLTRLISKQKTATSLLFRRFSVAAATATSTTTASSVISGSGRFLPGYLRPLSSFELRRLSLRGFSTEAEPPPESGEKTAKKKDKELSEDIKLEGCDFKHWMALMEKPKGDPTREEIIEGYIKTLASIVGSEEEAKKMMYSVSTKCYYAFSYIGEKDISEKLNEMDHVLFVVPDSYLYPINKDYGGEPFINGKAVPYDPKYHKDWLRNQAQNQNSSNNRGQGQGPNRNNAQNYQRGGYNNQHNNQQNGPRDGYNNQQNGPRGGYNNNQHNSPRDVPGSEQGF